jgi:hypothetical protein
MSSGLIFIILVDIIIFYLKIFCSEFFKTFKHHFRFFSKKRATWSTSSIYPLSIFTNYLATPKRFVTLVDLM